MLMNDLSKLIAVTFYLAGGFGGIVGLSSPALAQDAATQGAPAAETPAPDAAAPATDAAAPDGLALGKPVEDPNAPGSIYVSAVHGDWELRCVRAEDGSDPCQIYQLLHDTDKNPVAEISMFALPGAGKAVAGATIIAPLETLLTEQLQLKVDQGQGKAYPFTWCAREGCVARIGLTAEDVASFKRGAKATMTIVPVVAPDQKVVLDISLKGFTAAYDAVIATAAKP